jgi:uncharacterized protein
LRPVIFPVLFLLFHFSSQSPRRIDRQSGFRYILEMILGFFRLVFYLLVAYIIYLVLRLLLSPRRQTRLDKNRPRSSGLMVKDEWCNTYLPKEEAILEKADGKEYYFCSQECRKKFLARKKSDS